MVDLMEAQGYACRIVAVDTSVSGRENVYQLAVQIKESGERLNLSDTMFALGHPAFLRRLSFATCSSVPETRAIWSSQGSSANAFDTEYPTGKSEFYVPVITDNLKGTDELDLLPYVVPHGLPLDLKR
jgi:hypothetical protein